MFVIVVVVIIICLQIKSWHENNVRMTKFSDIFKNESSWDVKYDFGTGFVSGIQGVGNDVFESIRDSINKYLESNTGSIIDFNLLKDAVDRHCDSLEEEINTRMPIPLYLGLAGTMLGVIIGLFPLVIGDAMAAFLTHPGAVSLPVADAVQSLLGGVAAAMSASFVGIGLTTCNIWRFEKYKCKEDLGKNSFLAWMQARLLPALPSDMSSVMTELVRNLRGFNNTFSKNTEELGSTLGKVNEVYQSQEKIIQEIAQLDVVKMAKANKQVLNELEKCLQQLPACAGYIERFSEYLIHINQYLEIVKEFTSKLEAESGRLHVLEEIRDFFARHKGEISKDVADSDDALREALKSFKEASNSSIEEFKNCISKATADSNDALLESLKSLRQTADSSIEEFKKSLEMQSEVMKEMLMDNKKIFDESSQEMRDQFLRQLQQMPTLVKNLEGLSGIPAALDRLAERMERAIDTMITQTTNSVRPVSSIPKFPSWIKWTVLVGVIVIALACVTNTAYNIISNQNRIENSK